jgi:pilus assembly protein CpaB
MTARRLTLALIIALLTSGLFTFYLSKRVAKAASATAISPTRFYVAAGQALESGEILKASKLEMIAWPASAPLVEAFSKMDDVTGRTVLYPLAKGEPIVDRQLAAPGAGVGLTANIPLGMRAISVRSDEVVGVAGFLQPGTHVDVLLTYRSEKFPEARTATVLQNVVILATGQQIRPDPENKPVSVNVVTLLLKPADAERAVLATSLGASRFVLRNGADRDQASSPSIGLAELADTPGPVPGVAAYLHKMQPPKPEQYEVETILGDKQVVNSFN